MKASEIRDKSELELKEEIIGLRKQLFNIRFQSSAGESENLVKIPSIKKDIARIKTILTEKARSKSDNK